MIWDQLLEVYNLLEDDISKEIYEKRINWLLNGEKRADVFWDYLYEKYDQSRIIGLEVYSKELKFVICGAGKYGRQSKKALSHAGYNVACFLDNNRELWGKIIDGVPVLGFMEFASIKDLFENSVVIADNKKLSDTFFSQLCQLGFRRDRIYRTRDDIVRTAFGNIYFDLNEMQHSDNEIFLDAGAFDGQSTMDFIQWTKNKYEKIYVVEPMQEGFFLCKEKLKHIERVHFEKKALSNIQTKAKFGQSFMGLMGSRLGITGDITEIVEVDTIDSILAGNAVTYIKMDIEGAELNALIGAKETIKKYSPKLAISIYHNNYDMYKIPLWIKNNFPEYKLYIRHYSNKKWDTVLYCVK